MNKKVKAKNLFILKKCAFNETKPENERHFPTTPQVGKTERKQKDNRSW